MSTHDEKVKSPATLSMAYIAMAPKWAMIRNLLGGTAYMREAGTTYLPRHPHEKATAYAERLATTTLTNYTSLTLEILVGKPFSDPVKFNEDVPDSIKKFEDDVDLQGSTLHVFARNLFEQGMAKGFVHVLVDFPTVQPRADNQVRTLADDNADNLRPYWNMVLPENLIFASSEMINGVDTLTHIRIYQEEVIRDGFSEKVRKTITVHEIGMVTEYELKKDKQNKEAWIVVGTRPVDLDFIPLVTFYTHREGLMLCKPPLEDLAFLNVRHWQSTSDQISVTTVARFPMLAVSGAHDTDGDVLAIGPRQLLATRDPSGKFYYVEHTGKAIDAGLKDLSKIEDDMAAYGADFLRKRPGGTTATAKALDSVESTSPLQDITHHFIAALNQCLAYTAKWIGADDGGTVFVLTEFGPEKVNDVDFRALLEARRNRDISRETFLHEMQRRGSLSDDFDQKKNLKELEEEVPIESPFATGQNTGEKLDPEDNPQDPATAGAEQQNVPGNGKDMPGLPPPPPPKKKVPAKTPAKTPTKKKPAPKAK